MTPEEYKSIYSEDYADFIFGPQVVEEFVQKFKGATIQQIHDYLNMIRIPVEYIPEDIIKQYKYIIVPPLYGLISQTAIEKSGITRIRNIPKLNLRGKGVLVGIIDTGIDYTNPVFFNGDKTTKIAAIWDQTIQKNDNTTTTYYGEEYTKEQINQALQSDNPFEIVPTKDDIGHGTMLAGIIAGNEVPESNFYGVAPDAELVIVKLKQAKKNLKKFWKIPENSNCYQLNDIIAGLIYLDQVATRLNKPISICFAVGTSQGSHDGASILDRYISMYAENTNTSIQGAAGNEGNAKRHYSGLINSTKGFDIVELKVGDKESGFVVELWGDAPGLFSVEIKTPSGEIVPRISPRLNRHISVSLIFEPTTIEIDYQIVESQSGAQLILFRFTDPSPGIWTFQVYGTGTLELKFNMWLPMEGFISEDTFFLDSDPNTTLLSPGSSLRSITVTAYNPANDAFYQNSSRGFDRKGNIKPDITAPGVNIVYPNLEKGFSEASGTSPAVAFTTGVAAMLLEWGIVNGNLPIMNTADIKTLMIRGAKRDPSIVYPNQEWGYGILDVLNIFISLSRGI